MVKKASVSPEFTRRLREMRRSLKISQAEAAQACGGWRTDTWSRIERGDSAGIGLDMLSGIADFALSSRISLAWLFTGVGKMFDTPRSAQDWSWLEAATRDELLEELIHTSVYENVLLKLLKKMDNPQERRAFLDEIRMVNEE